MAEILSSMELPESKTPRRRKPKFSATEMSILTEKVMENIEVLHAKLSNSTTNRMKSDIWEKITEAVNAIGRTSRSTQEVRDKWKNLQSMAKEFSDFRHELMKTSGGPAPKRPCASSEKISRYWKICPAFSGLDGFEVGGPVGTGEKL